MFSLASVCLYVDVEEEKLTKNYTKLTCCIRDSRGISPDMVRESQPGNVREL